MLAGLWEMVRRVHAAAEGPAGPSAGAGPRFDLQTSVVLLTACIALTTHEYAFRRAASPWTFPLLERLAGPQAAAALTRWTGYPEDPRLAELLHWALGTYVGYVAIPCLVLRFVLRKPLSEHGVRWRGAGDGAWLYGLMLLAMLPAVWHFSQTERFLETYPFYRLQPGEPLWPRFVLWELCYFGQFFALEFFFRGFLLHGLRPRFGFQAIFVMTVPYCMIHFAKPWQETCGAMGAGVVLGFMSLKTGSIWLGALLHVAVAFAMDGLALWHRGFFIAGG